MLGFIWRVGICNELEELIMPLMVFQGLNCLFGPELLRCVFEFSKLYNAVFKLLGITGALRAMLAFN